MHTKTGILWILFYPLSLCLLILLTYSATLANGFVYWDDQKFILNNPFVQSLTIDNLVWMLTEIDYDHWHPLTWLSLATTYYFSGPDATAYHLDNILLHCANALWLFVLVWVLAGRWTSPSLPAGQFKLFCASPRILWIAWFAAVLYALHPQRVEVVAWAAARKDILSLFFILATLFSYTLYNAAVSPQTKRYWYILSLLCFLLALGAKTIAVTVPVLLLILDFHPFRRMHSLPAIRNALWEKLPFFLLSAGPVLMTFIGQERIQTILHVDLVNRVFNAANSIILYVSKLFFPFHLAPFYPHPFFGGPEPGIIPLLAVGLITLLCVYAWYKKQPYWLAGWLFYLLALSPVSGIWQVGAQSSADRYTYLPMLPFYLLLGVAAVKMYLRYRSRLWRTAWIIGLGLLVLGLVGLSRNQTLLWRNDLTFWYYAVEYEPDNYITRANYAEANIRAGRYAEAAKQYTVIFRDYSQLASAADYFNLAFSYMEREEYPKAFAVYRFILDKQLPLGEKYAAVYARLSRLYLLQGLDGQARAALHKAIEIDPRNAYALKLKQEYPGRLTEPSQLSSPPSPEPALP